MTDLKLKVERAAVTLSSTDTSFNGNQLLYDDANYILYNDGDVSVALHLASKDAANNTRTYAGYYNNVKYILTCNITNISSITFTLKKEGIEYFTLYDIATFNIIGHSTADDDFKLVVYDGRLAHLQYYCSSTTSQSATGWKNLLAFKSSWKYAVDNNGGTLSYRGVGSMYTSNGYINSALQITKATPDVIQAYYTTALKSQTGGLNLDLWFNVKLR